MTASPSRHYSRRLKEAEEENAWQRALEKHVDGGFQMQLEEDGGDCT